MSRFQQLQDLQLWGNKLTGSVPPSWSAEGSFPALFTLLIQNNQLSGSLPSRAEKALASLKQLNVSGNRQMDSPMDDAWSQVHVTCALAYELFTKHPSFARHEGIGWLAEETMASFRPCKPSSGESNPDALQHSSHRQST